MSLTSGTTMDNIVSSAEDSADKVLRYSRNYLPFIARLCLISTFLEDGIRMIFQWEDQREYVRLTWNTGNFIAVMFVLINMFAQLAGCVLILIRKFVPIGVGILFGVILLQTLVYTVLWDFKFFLRNLALTGALLLVLAEFSAEAKTMFAGLPSMGNNQKQSYMQLVGRVLVVFMFLTLMNFEFSLIRFVLAVGGLSLIVCVFIGFKTKLAALVLVALLSLINVIFNPFWMIPSNAVLRDFMKYDFFQTLSVIGGLLYIVALGPGGVSVDELKRE